MALHTLTGSGSPVGAVTPDYLGQHYVDTGTNTIYQAYSTTNADWSANLTAAKAYETLVSYGGPKSLRDQVIRAHWARLPGDRRPANTAVTLNS